MNKKYLKYHRDYKDMQDKPINIGDKVVINNYYKNMPRIGTVSHYTESGRVAVKVVTGYNVISGTDNYYYCYRFPNTIIIIE